MTLREFHVFPWAIVLGAIVLGHLLSGVATAGSDGGLRLIMVQAAECRFCQRWEAEVGKVYDRSAEGRRAPLVRVERGAAEIAGMKPATFTPTFILAEGNREISRIVGYPGQGYFWEELADMLRLVEQGASEPVPRAAGPGAGGME